MEARKEVSLAKMIELEEELAQVKKEYGIKEKRKLWVRIGDFLAGRLRDPVTVSRKKYLTLALSCGWLCGAHRFYTKDYFVGALYFLFSWTGFAAAMTIVDVLVLYLKHEKRADGTVDL